MPSRSYLFPENAEHLVAIAEGLAGRADGSVPSPLEDPPKYPPLVEVDDLPKLMGISPSIVTYFLSRPSRHYRTFEMSKKSGGTRTISSPRTWLKVTQWWINDNILVHYPLKECVYGFVRGRGPRENAEYHQGARHLLNLDVKDFFPSIGVEACASVFAKLGYNKDVSKRLAWICTLNNELPQGAPTSPAISNIYMEGLDDSLMHYCGSRGMKYSRYADDMTISSREFIESDVVKKVSEMLKPYGLTLNKKKTCFMGRGDRMEVTGYNINENVQLSRHWRRTARAKLHRYLTGQDVDFDWHHVVGLFGAISNQQNAENSALYRLAKTAAQKGKPK